MCVKKAFYFLEKKLGSKSAIAKEIGVSKATITNWIKGDRKVRISRLPELIKLSDFKLTEKDFRPDIFKY